jgi:enoyl-[acyl-carrier-protein] reductase (NADH)
MASLSSGYPQHHAVAFLGMNAAKLITGDTLYIDGGYHIIH